MLTLREIRAESAYDNFYESAYPLGLDDPIRSASLDDIALSTISAAITNGEQADALSSSSAQGQAQQPVTLSLPKTLRVTEQQDYGNVSMLPVSVTAADQTPLIKPSTRRVFLQIQNRTASANTVYVAFGTTASDANGVEILPGGSATWDEFVPQDDVHVVCATGGTATIVMVYCNKAENE